MFSSPTLLPFNFFHARYSTTKPAWYHGGARGSCAGPRYGRGGGDLWFEEDEDSDYCYLLDGEVEEEEEEEEEDIEKRTEEATAGTVTAGAGCK